MKKNNKNGENYLTKIPCHKSEIPWEQDESGIVTLQIANKGIFNKIAQVLFKKPKVSFIHLDEFGSFVWLSVDGSKNIIEIGKTVKEHFGDKANPLYERLAKFFQILDSYSFIAWKE